MPPPTPAATVAPPQAGTTTVSTGDQGGGPQLMTLRLMRDKGIITQAEFESALNDLKESVGEQAKNGMNVVVSKWSTTLYGFAEGDYIYDSTQSFKDIPGATLVARPDTYAGQNSRTQFSTRNSRFGLRLKAPEYHGIRESALFESDFVVDVEPIGVTQPYNETEGQYFTNPVLRTRHFYLKVENPIVDALFGQTWHLFGWQSSYHPNTDQPQGVPGQLYSRTPQLRLSKTVKTEDITFDVAVAAMRPPQRDSGIPEGEAGLHLAFNKWTGTQTIGATGTTVSPLSVAVTGDLRAFSVPAFAAKPTYSNDLTTTAIAADAFVPVLPGTENDKGNSLSLLGEFVTGYGISDMMTGWQSGVTYPSLPAPMGMAAPTFNPDIDPGFVVYDSAGKLHGVQWTSYRFGAQYYLPGLDGKFWISGNYSHVQSANAHLYGSATATLSNYDWFDVNMMGDLTPAIRLGIEYANYNTMYSDATHAINHRIYASAFYIF